MTTLPNWPALLAHYLTLIGPLFRPHGHLFHISTGHDFDPHSPLAISRPFPHCPAQPPARSSADSPQHSAHPLATLAGSSDRAPSLRSTDYQGSECRDDSL